MSLLRQPEAATWERATSKINYTQQVVLPPYPLTLLLCAHTCLLCACCMFFIWYFLWHAQSTFMRCFSLHLKNFIHQFVAVVLFGNCQSTWHGTPNGELIWAEAYLIWRHGGGVARITHTPCVAMSCCPPALTQWVAAAGATVAASMQQLRKAANGGKKQQQQLTLIRSSKMRENYAIPCKE